MKLFTLPAAVLSLLAVTAGTALAQAPANDACSGAIDISASFGQPIGTVVNTGPYDNTNATIQATDPISGYECFGEPNGNGTAPTLDNTLWFSFVGDGNLYFIETGQCTPALPASDYIDDGDTQIAIYTGSCGSLVPVTCNEDGPSATSTTYPAGLSFRPDSGVTYYMLIDGFSFNGAISRGQFCIEVSRMADITCTDTTVSPGMATSSTTTVCPGATVNFTSTGVSTPNVGEYFGVSWMITNVDLMGSLANVTQQSLIATYGFNSPAPATSTRSFTHDGTLIDGAQIPYGTYYWTPIVFGMATPDPSEPNPVFLSDLVLDPNCVQLGASLPVAVLAGNDPACNPIGIADAVNSSFAITSMYPVPVQNELSVEVTSPGNATLTLVVRDVLGRVVSSNNKAAVAGANKFVLDMQNESAGLYVVTVTDGANTAVSKFVKE